MHINPIPKEYCINEIVERVVRTLRIAKWVAEILSYCRRELLDIAVVGVALRRFKSAPTIEKIVGSKIAINPFGLSLK